MKCNNLNSQKRNSVTRSSWGAFPSKERVMRSEVSDFVQGFASRRLSVGEPFAIPRSPSGCNWWCGSPSVSNEKHHSKVLHQYSLDTCVCPSWRPWRPPNKWYVVIYMFLILRSGENWRVLADIVVNRLRWTGYPWKSVVQFKYSSSTVCPSCLEGFHTCLDTWNDWTQCCPRKFCFHSSSWIVCLWTQRPLSVSDFPRIVSLRSSVHLEALSYLLFLLFMRPVQVTSGANFSGAKFFLFL